MSMTEGAELLKDTLHIPQIVDQVRQDDDIELFIQPRKIMGIGNDESKVRMKLPGAADHLFGKINAYTAGGFERCKQISLGAAKLKNISIRAYVKAIDFTQSPVVPAAHAAPGGSFACDRIPVSDAFLLVGDGGCIGEGSKFHNCMIVRADRRIEKVACTGPTDGTCLRRNCPCHLYPRPGFCLRM